MGDAVYEYNLSSNAFTEAVGNDGLVEGSLIVSISNDIFTSAGATLTSPTDFTIDNLPVGLIPSMTVAADGITATLDLSGKANDNEQDDDLIDLQFTFADGAFVNSNAVDVINATGPASSDLGIDFFDNPILSYSSAIDISTANFTGGTFSVAGQEPLPRGLAINNDGSRFYVAASSTGRILEYFLNPAFDLSSAILNGSLSVTDHETAPSGVTLR